eukprot:5988503-Amphidinium_carterae.1
MSLFFPSLCVVLNQSCQVRQDRAEKGTSGWDQQSLERRTFTDTYGPFRSDPRDLNVWRNDS